MSPKSAGLAASLCGAEAGNCKAGKPTHPKSFMAVLEGLKGQASLEVLLALAGLAVFTALVVPVVSGVKEKMGFAACVVEGEKLLERASQLADSVAVLGTGSRKEEMLSGISCPSKLSFDGNKAKLAVTRKGSETELVRVLRKGASKAVFELSGKCVAGAENRGAEVKVTVDCQQLT